MGIPLEMLNVSCTVRHISFLSLFSLFSFFPPFLLLPVALLHSPTGPTHRPTPAGMVYFEISKYEMLCRHPHIQDFRNGDWVLRLP